MGFHKDLHRGQKAEERVHNALGGARSEGRVKSHDLTVEVKKDFMVESTGNVALEYEAFGKPSGVLAGADIVIYEIGNKVFKCDSEALSSWIYEHKHEYQTIERGGGRDRTKILLLPLYVFIQLFDFCPLY